MRPARATKKSNPGSSKPTSTASQQGRRDAGSGVVNKNSKEQYIKRLQMCMKNYDYKDEQKDVKGKAERLNAIHELQMMLTD
mmetsp:Transcript_18427/g.24739  ORF Transcript_18427/g.24739 Transcript_18427/m.24739 type:complete len:82 (+) Transcript_18427:24-269(+)